MRRDAEGADYAGSCGRRVHQSRCLSLDCHRQADFDVPQVAVARAHAAWVGNDRRSRRRALVGSPDRAMKEPPGRLSCIRFDSSTSMAEDSVGRASMRRSAEGADYAEFLRKRRVHRVTMPQPGSLPPPGEISMSRKSQWQSTRGGSADRTRISWKTQRTRNLARGRRPRLDGARSAYLPRQCRPLYWRVRIPMENLVTAPALATSIGIICPS